MLQHLSAVRGRLLRAPHPAPRPNLRVRPHEQHVQLELQHMYNAQPQAWPVPARSANGMTAMAALVPARSARNKRRRRVRFLNRVQEYTAVYKGGAAAAKPRTP